MKLFDTHAHVGLIQDDQMSQLLAVQMAKVKGVTHVVSITNSLADFEKTYDNLKSNDSVLHAVGVSPTEVLNPGPNWEERVMTNAKRDRVVAIGETGLDYHHYAHAKTQQIELMLRHLDIARILEKPVIIHNRDAKDDLLPILIEKMPPKGGILHCFGEDWTFARKVLDLDLYFSFAGNLTFKHNRNLHEVAYRLPQDRILIESEAPFMTPHRYKGERNKIHYLVETLYAIAEIRDMAVEDLAEVIYANSFRAFALEREP
ncbi:MAG: YchF/TatD family DNA exonuclease [Spirochaetales bacterium]|nr:YchF/TatD family DNA exonuclease [Spirochaetales bacterium]